MEKERERILRSCTRFLGRDYPQTPQTNMMHVFLRGNREKLEAAALSIAQETHTLLFLELTPTILPTYQKFELSIGDASLDISTEEIIALFQALFEKAEAG